MARHRVIGHDGGMPWRLPADLKHFKAVTLGHPVLMGRRTFESIGRALPGRHNIVVSRGRPELPAGVLLVPSLEAALDQVPDERLMVIGGGEIYRQALPMAHRLELTFIDAAIAGDTTFPDWSSEDWLLERMRARPADADNAHGLVFASFRRADARSPGASPLQWRPA